MLKIIMFRVIYEILHLRVDKCLEKCSDNEVQGRGHYSVDSDEL